MRVSLWIIFSLAVALWRRRDPFPLVLGAVALWILVPQQSAGLITGGAPDILDMHPASWLLLVTSAVQAFANPRQMQRGVLHRVELVILLAVPFIVAWTTALSLPGGAAQMSQAGEQLLAPALAFALLCVSIKARPGRSATLVTLLLALGIVETVLAQVQALLNSPVPYVADVTEQYWYSDHFGRWMGTFNHPLSLSAFLVVCVVLTVRLQRWWVRLGLVVLFCYGVLLTQSRFGLGAAAVAAAYALLFGRGRRLGRVIPSAVFAGAALYGLGAGWFAAVLDRFASDTTSTEARSYGAQVFLDHLDEYVWTGHGLGASFDISHSAGVGASFENSFFMLSVDIGLVPTVMLFVGAVFGCLYALGRERLPGPAMAGLLLVVTVQSFSAFGNRTPLVLLLYVLVACAVAEPVGRYPWSRGSGSTRGTALPSADEVRRAAATRSLVRG